MQIHCPECGYEGELNRGTLRKFWTLLARIYGQTNVTCPKCGFHKAFSRNDWDKTHA